jgi:hypothetical protein
MASYAYTFTSGDTLTPTKLNAVRTATDIVNADISASAAIVYSKLNLASSVALADLVTSVANALVPSGSVQAFAMTTAPAGWLALNGNTIGSAGSGANSAAADYAALFTVLWNNWTNTLLPILDSAGAASTRGASAAADFAANKRLPLPDVRGYFIRASGTNADAVAAGTFGTKQAHAVGQHTHPVRTGTGSGGSTTRVQSGVAFTGSATIAGAAENPDGGSFATETRPSNIAMLYCIKF